MSAGQFNKWGVYVHVPWCHRRCTYCDFYFEIGKANLSYSDNIKTEFISRRSDFPEKAADTLYFGGGTPSLLEPSQINKIIDFLHRQNHLDKNSEITLEANPEDLSLVRLSGLQQAGVNRLSLGIQSFSDSTLAWLGRKHRSAEAKQSVIDSVNAGFENISVDLMVGVPGESRSDIEQSVHFLLEKGVKHISVYVLTVEENTPLKRHIKQGKKLPPKHDKQAEAYEHIQNLLKSKGFVQYEISSYAMPGFESLHNRIYWAQGEYLGLGPGAHSMLLRPDGSVERQKNPSNLALWQSAPSKAFFVEEVLSPGHGIKESLAFGIRDVLRGISPQVLAERHVVALPKSFPLIKQRLISSGWVYEAGERLFLTTQGTRFADAVAREFLGM